MSEIEQLIHEIKEAKDRDKEEFEKVKYTRNKNKIKNADLPKYKSKIVKLTSKDQVYEEMKLRFRSQWKSLI